MKAKVLIIILLVAIICNATAQTPEKVYITAKIGGKEGIINGKGEWVIQPVYNRVDKKVFAPNGLVAVNVSGKWGYINKNGETIINPQFGYASSFAENGLARVELEDKWGYIDQTGKFVIDPQFDWAGDFNQHGLAEVK